MLTLGVEMAIARLSPLGLSTLLGCWMLWSAIAGVFADFNIPSDNGVAELLVNDYADKFYHDLKDAKFSEKILKDRLKGLYYYLKYHPAVMERRLHVGPRPPTHAPEYSYNEQKRGGRGFNPRTARSACPHTAGWERIHWARDINDSQVEVKQSDQNRQQWFHIVTCDSNRIGQPGCNNCCFGINRRRYSSTCLPQKSYVMALVRSDRHAVFDWSYIQVDSSCVCAVSPRNGKR